MQESHEIITRPNKEDKHGQVAIDKGMVVVMLMLMLMLMMMMMMTMMVRMTTVSGGHGGSLCYHFMDFYGSVGW